MPAYCIQQDSPWMPGRGSAAPTVSSTYSDDYGQLTPHYRTQDFSPLHHKSQQNTSYHPSYHAHPQQEIHDRGPHVRQSRLPVFKQVRHMLQPAHLTAPGDPKWDQYTSDPSRGEKPAQTRLSPFDEAFKGRKQSPVHSNGNHSPVSVLRDDEIDSSQSFGEAVDRSSTASPVSPLHAAVPEEDHNMIPSPLSLNVQRSRQTTQSPLNHQIKRKPALRSMSMAENEPPSPPHAPHDSDISQTTSSAEYTDTRLIDDRDVDEARQHEPTSRFSWTTYEPSIAPTNRHSTDTMATRHTKQLPPRPADAIVQPKSHFSWSTYATTTHNLRGSTPPSPPPPLPEKPSQTPRGPQMQSILSRSRPIQRQDREDPPPPPYAAKLSAVPRNPAPKSAKPANSASAAPPPRNDSLPNIPARKPPSTHSTTNSQDKSTKPLPAPPISPGATPITHLDHLLLAQTSLLTQRSNLERAIAETRKVELASPLEVPFAHVRDAKRKKEAFEKRLEGILLEEQEVGIKVSRARRREEREEGFGEGEALWVRRVTG